MLATYPARWPAPSHIGALTTTRTNNKNRYTGEQLKLGLSLPSDPFEIKLVHGNQCITVEHHVAVPPEADAIVTRHRSIPLAITTADCLPILICNQAGTEIAAIHAGWRGLVQGIVENTLKAMKSNPEQCLAWIGPGICQDCFEIGDEVHEAYTKAYPYSAAAFSKRERYHANLPQIATMILNRQGVKQVFPSGACTFEDQKQFYSYRRQPQTGRMTTIIWFKDRIAS